MQGLWKRSSIALLITFVITLTLNAPAALPVASAPLLPEVDTTDLVEALEADAQSSPEFTKRYIVILQDPPLASYRGGIPGLDATAVDTAGGKIVDGEETIHLAIDTPAAKAYLDYLEARQDAVIAKVRYMAPEFAQDDWRYSVATNGFTAELTASNAAKVLQMPEVRLIYPEQELIPDMDATMQLVGTAEAWAATGGDEEAGLGARVAVLEAGSYAEHPFFNDEGMPAPPDGYPSAKVYTRNGDVHDLEAPEILVNNKIIGTRIFVTGASEQQLANYKNGSGRSSHGLHVSGTVAGRFGTYKPSDIYNYEPGYTLNPGNELDLAGVAPMAYLFHYPVGDGTPGMIKAFDLMVEEEIDAVNLSLGTVTWLLDTPELHPVSVAMSGAADGGVLVVGSAGNAGANGRTSLSGSWKYSEDLMVVGNTYSTSGPNYIDPVITGDNVPDELNNLIAGPRGVPFITQTLEADLVYVPEGACEPDESLVSGKIAVFGRFAEDGSWIGPCGYTARAQLLKDAGAVGAVYIYYNTTVAGASTTPLALPSISFGTRQGVPLVEFLENGGQARISIPDYSQIKRTYDNTVDFLNPSSSQGPGLDWSIKPDISAPGTNIMSSYVTGNPIPPAQRPEGAPGTLITWGSLTGTSMAAPHITGAAGFLRSKHPNWTVQQLRSALITTSEPVITTGDEDDPEIADPTKGGPGRLDLTDAYDPKAFIHPPKASFGALDAGEARTLEFELVSQSEEDRYWDLSIDSGAGDAGLMLSEDHIMLEAEASHSFTLELDATDATESEHWGYVVLTESEKRDPDPIYIPAVYNKHDMSEDAFDAQIQAEISAEETDAINQEDEDEDEDGEPRVLRLAYYAYMDNPETRSDVLIVNWTYGNTEDYTSYYTDALDELGLSYSIWSMGDEEDHAEEDRKLRHPTFEEMYRHDLTILNANMSPESLQEYLRGQFQYQNYLLGGGNMLIAGQGTQGWWRYLGGNPLGENNRAAFPETWPYQWLEASQNVGCEKCLSRYFAGFTPEYTATLSGRLLVPFPSPADEPEMEVLLEPHPEAESVFDYPLDISTGEMAKDDALGNQYRFASGDIMRDYVPTTNTRVTSELGDSGSAFGVMQRYQPYARPLWSYTVSDTLKVVGTYIAGKRYEDTANVPWNAMYWGFGLEGVGENMDAGAVSRSRLLGDTFNFLGKNIVPEVLLEQGPEGAWQLDIDLGDTAAEVRFESAEITWSDNRIQRLDYEVPASQLDLDITLDAASISGDAHPVQLKLIPVQGEAAPIYADLH